MGIFNWSKKKNTDKENLTNNFTLPDFNGRLEDGTLVKRTEIESKGYHGWFLRGYNKQRKEYQMLDSYFDDELPRWIEDVPVPLVAGKGIPTTLYLDIRLMKMFEIKPLELKRIIICKIHDWNSLFHLKYLHEKYPKEKLNELFKNTRLFKSRANVIIQTGLQITDIEIDPEGAEFSHPQHLLNDNFTSVAMNELCNKYDVNKQDMIYWNFNVIINVKPN